jgi:integral membrane protein
MKNLITTSIGRFKLVALLEGLSFLLLLGVAMPLKYLWGKPWMVQNVGMIHGILFVLYIVQIIQLKIEMNWPTGKTLLAIVLSFVPFGPFYVTERMLPNLQNPTQK